MATARNSTSKTKGIKTTEKVTLSYDPQKAAASKASKTSATKKSSGTKCPRCGYSIGR